MKIGILGGTFDPIHNAHVYMAKQALKSLSLNRVYLMPAFVRLIKMRTKLPENIIESI